MSHRGFESAAAATSSGPCAGLFDDSNMSVQDDKNATPIPAESQFPGEAPTTRVQKTLPAEDAPQTALVSEGTTIPVPKSPPTLAREVEEPPAATASTLKAASTRRRSPTMRIPSPAVMVAERAKRKAALATAERRADARDPRPDEEPGTGVPLGPESSGIPSTDQAEVLNDGDRIKVLEDKIIMLEGKIQKGTRMKYGQRSETLSKLW